MNIMLRNFSQNLAKSHSAPYSRLSLTTVPMFFKSRRKTSRINRIKKFLRDPRYKRIVKMKIPNLKDPAVVFPIVIPLKSKFVYRPKKSKLRLPEHDYINFKVMTGNEILLNLSNVEHLRPSEFASALLELGKRDGASEVDWNNHEWIQKCVGVATKYLSQYDARVVSSLLYAFHRLGVKDELLWSTFARESSKTVHKIRPKGFGATFICFTAESDRCTREYKERLASLLPVHLRRMNPTLFTRCFELAIKDKLMTEYLFDDHFFWVIWKKSTWLGGQNYPKIIRGLIEYGYKDDLEFWNKDFLPTIEKIADKLTANQAEAIIESLQFAEQHIPELRAQEYIDLLNQRVVFCKTTLVKIENSKFWNVVKNDIEYFREKERMRLEKEKQSA